MPPHSFVEWVVGRNLPRNSPRRRPQPGQSTQRSQRTQRTVFRAELVTDDETDEEIFRLAYPSSNNGRGHDHYHRHRPSTPPAPESSTSESDASTSPGNKASPPAEKGASGDVDPGPGTGSEGEKTAASSEDAKPAGQSPSSDTDSNSSSSASSGPENYSRPCDCHKCLREKRLQRRLSRKKIESKFLDDLEAAGLSDPELFLSPSSDDKFNGPKGSKKRKLVVPVSHSEASYDTDSESTKPKPPDRKRDVAEAKPQSDKKTAAKETTANEKAQDKTEPNKILEQANMVHSPNGRAEVIHVDHGVQDAASPHPNAYLDPQAGICKVYHGPPYGHSYPAMYTPQAYWPSYQAYQHPCCLSSCDWCGCQAAAAQDKSRVSNEKTNKPISKSEPVEKKYVTGEVCAEPSPFPATPETEPQQDESSNTACLLTNSKVDEQATRVQNNVGPRAGDATAQTCNDKGTRSHDWETAGNNTTNDNSTRGMTGNNRTNENSYWTIADDDDNNANKSGDDGNGTHWGTKGDTSSKQSANEWGDTGGRSSSWDNNNNNNNNNADPWESAPGGSGNSIFGWEGNDTSVNGYNNPRKGEGQRETAWGTSSVKNTSSNPPQSNIFVHAVVDDQSYWNKSRSRLPSEQNKDVGKQPPSDILNNAGPSGPPRGDHHTSRQNLADGLLFEGSSNQWSPQDGSNKNRAPISSQSGMGNSGQNLNDYWKNTSREAGSNGVVRTSYDWNGSQAKSTQAWEFSRSDGSNKMKAGSHNWSPRNNKKRDTEGVSWDAPPTTSGWAVVPTNSSCKFHQDPSHLPSSQHSQDMPRQVGVNYHGRSNDYASAFGGGGTTYRHSSSRRMGKSHGKNQIDSPDPVRQENIDPRSRKERSHARADEAGSSAWGINNDIPCPHPAENNIFPVARELKVDKDSNKASSAGGGSPWGGNSRSGWGNNKLMPGGWNEGAASPIPSWGKPDLAQNPEGPIDTPPSQKGGHGEKNKQGEPEGWLQTRSDCNW